MVDDGDGVVVVIEDSKAVVGVVFDCVPCLFPARVRPLNDAKYLSILHNLNRPLFRFPWVDAPLTSRIFN